MEREKVKVSQGLPAAKTNSLGVRLAMLCRIYFDANDKNIEYELDASPASGAIQLTKNLRNQNIYSSVGGVKYREPMHLWDKISGNLTDFTTHFTFVIDSQNVSHYADGMAFFLAPVGSNMTNGTGGGALGLPLNQHPFVAVEFDIHQNEWDPPDKHVGIDSNSDICG
ncbi:hypothetical protein VNO77_05176 [Canavalia gladiata]|uniref:Legume lectin domain-containing protein n=1 Tax=Canavalia gladiata TaxID=3824 RepID=A0AAN9R8F0_CANGL